MHVLQNFLNNNIEILEIRKNYILCNFAKIITVKYIIYSTLQIYCDYKYFQFIFHFLIKLQMLYGMFKNNFYIFI